MNQSVFGSYLWEVSGVNGKAYFKFLTKRGGAYWRGGLNREGA